MKKLKKVKKSKFKSDRSDFGRKLKAVIDMKRNQLSERQKFINEPFCIQIKNLNLNVLWAKKHLFLRKY